MSVSGMVFEVTASVMIGASAGLIFAYTGGAGRSVGSSALDALMAAGGKAVNGTREADGPKSLRQVLRKDGVFLTELREVVGGKQAAAASSGIIDGIGYLGGVLAGVAVARLSVAYGWQGVFVSLSGVCAFAAVAAACLYALYLRRSRGHAR